VEEDAFSILDSRYLPHPRTFGLPDLLAAGPDDTRYYLRFSRGKPFPAVMSGGEIASVAGELTRLVADGVLLQIEETISSIAGGCAVRTPEGVYVEMALGHASGLLRHGWCALRAFWGPGAGSRGTIATLSQPNAIDSDTRSIVHTSATESADLVIACSSVNDYLFTCPSRTLYEFILSPTSAILFVDTKDYRWNLDFSVAAQGIRGASVFGSARDLQPDDIYSGPLDVSLLRDNATPRRAGIHLGRNAALCHFVTYSLRTGATIYLEV